jgi:hypothetical protein
MVSDMLVYLILALVVLLGGIILSFKARDDLKAFSACLTLSVSFAISILVFPAYVVSGNDLLISLLGSINYGVRAVAMNVSGGMLDGLELEGTIGYCYKTFLYVLYILGPTFASIFVVSLFRNFNDSIRMMGKRRIHVFSRINERSLAIAESLKEKQNGALVFCNGSSTDDQLKTRARAIHAIIREGNERLHIFKNFKYEFYEIADDREQCMIDTSALCDHLTNGKQKNYAKENVIIRFFVSRDSLELIRNLDRQYGDKVYLRYVDEENAMAVDLFRTYKNKLIESMHNNIFIFGANELSLAILRNALCLMIWPGSSYEIHVFDRNVEELAERLNSESPEVLNEPFDSYFAKTLGKKANYNIYFHPFDNNDADFAEEIKDLGIPNIIFVCKDDDEDNYNTSLQLKRLFGSLSKELIVPFILCDLKDKNLNLMIEDDNIVFFGNRSSRYDYKRIIAPEIEESAKRIHLSYYSDENHDYLADDKQAQDKMCADTNYYAYVNQNSSYGAALSAEYKLAYILKNKPEGVDDEEYVRNYLSDKKNIDSLAVSEHQRWNTYQRLQGWRKASLEQAATICRQTNGKKVKDDDLLLHPAVVEYDELLKVEKRIDKIYAKNNVDKKCNYVEADKKIVRSVWKIVNGSNNG